MHKCTCGSMYINAIYDNADDLRSIMDCKIATVCYMLGLMWTW